MALQRDFTTALLTTSIPEADDTPDARRLYLLDPEAKAHFDATGDADEASFIAAKNLAGFTPASSFQNPNATEDLVTAGVHPGLAPGLVRVLEQERGVGQLRREATLAHREGTTKTAAALSVERSSATDLARRRRARGVGGSNDPDSLLSTGGGGGGLFS